MIVILMVGIPTTYYLKETYYWKIITTEFYFTIEMGDDRTPRIDSTIDV